MQLLKVINEIYVTWPPRGLNNKRSDSDFFLLKKRHGPCHRTLKARFLDQPQGEVHHVESYFTYQIWLNCLTILPNAEISYHFVTRVHQCDLNSPDLVIAPLLYAASLTDDTRHRGQLVHASANLQAVKNTEWSTPPKWLMPRISIDIELALGMV